jgi:hypothetical protein
LKLFVFITFLVLSFISRDYLISPSVVVAIAVSSPLPAYFVDFWGTPPFVVMRIFSIGKSVCYLH